MRRSTAVALLAAAGAMVVWNTTRDGRPAELPPQSSAPVLVDVEDVPRPLVGADADRGEPPWPPDTTIRHLQPIGQSVGPGDTAATVQLAVVHSDGQPVAAAQVWYVDESCIPNRHNPGGASRPEAGSLVERLKAIGKFRVADNEGHLSLPVVGGHLTVRGEGGAESATASFEVDGPHPDVLHLVLAAGDTLRVDLFDPSGVPIVDAPILAGPVANGSIIDSACRCRLGHTDGDGRLEFAGWQRLRAEMRELVPDAMLAVGAGYCGALRANVVVPDVPVDAVRIVAPRPVRLRVEIRDAGGALLPWRGLLLTLCEAPATSPGLAVVAADGFAVVFAVPDRSYRWQFGSDASRAPALVLGSGEVRCAAQALLTVTCSEVVGVRGRIAHGESVDGITVQYASKWRGRQDLELHVGGDRCFRLQLARGEDHGPLLFRRGQEAASIAFPVLDGPVADLGIVSISGREFASLRLIDEQGGPVAEGVVAVAGQAREGATVRRSEPGVHRIFVGAGDNRIDVELDCSAPGRQRRFVRVRPGERAEVTLAAVKNLGLGVRLASGVPPARVWARLWRRWDDAQQQWLFADEWAPCTASGSGDDVAEVTLRGIVAGHYRARIMSSFPPAVLAEAEVDLRTGVRPVLDATTARVVQVDLDFAPGVGPACCLAAETTVLQWEREPMGFVRVGPGRVDCVVRGEERRLLIIGPHVSGRWLEVDAAAATARIEAWNGLVVPGVDPDVRLVRPLGSAFGPDRSCQVWSIEATGVRREILHLDELMGAWNGWLLPVDYEAADVNGQSARIYWSPTTGWRVGS